MTVSFSPYDRQFHQDPYPMYEQLRAQAPVYRNEELDFWALSRYQDVATALGDFETYSSANGVMLEPSAWSPQAWKYFSFAAMDPPRHTSTRGLLSRAFTPRRVAALEPRIREIARGYVDAAVERGSFDFMTDLAIPLPLDTISELVGVPESDRAQVRALVSRSLHREEGMRDVPPSSMMAGLGLAEYYLGLVQERRRRPADDMLSALVDPDTVGARLTDPELVAMLTLLVGAGSETTTNLLGSAWYWAWRNPDQRAAAFAGNITGWTEETLRYESPGQLTARMVTRDLELRGVRVPARSRMVLLIGSANRDEEVFPCADRYDLDRDARKHISFSTGRHFCIGSSLGRLEAKLALEQLITQVKPDYEIDMDGATRIHSANVRGFETLPTSVTPG
jgi:cytochrome P450